MIPMLPRGGHRDFSPEKVKVLLQRRAITIEQLCEMVERRPRELRPILSGVTSCPAKLMERIATALDVDLRLVSTSPWD